MNSEESKRSKGGFATRAIHFSYDPAIYSGALTPPVFMTSTYAFESAEDGEALFRGERQGYVYGRTRNPTQALLEERVASLEGAEAALAVASGMAAISSTCWSLLKSGDQVLIDHTLYGNTFAFFMRGLPRFGVKVAVADFTDLGAVEAASAEFAPKLIFCIDTFQANRAPDLRYRTSPIGELFTHFKGGFYHDGRFANLGQVVDHYNKCLALGLSGGEKNDLVQYLLSLTFGSQAK